MPETSRLDYAPPDPRRNTRRLWLAIAIIAGCIMVMVVVIPNCGLALRHTQSSVNSVKCATNLRQIGQAVQMYANDYGGTYPPDLQAVFLTQRLTPDMFICPETSDTAARGDDMAAKAKELAKPGHCSYIYVGSGLTTRSSPDCVVAFHDPQKTHGANGGNVLFQDGHVEFVGFPSLVQILNELQADHNPPSMTPLPTLSQAQQDFQKNWKSRIPQLKTGVWRIPTTAPATRE